MTTKLTKTQQSQLENLQTNGKLFVGYNCPSVLRTFDKLVDKGLAKVVDISNYGKHYHKIEKMEQ